MKLHSIFTNRNSKLPLHVSILELDNEGDLNANEGKSAASHFAILKRYHFNFPVSNVNEVVPMPVYNPLVNYSNYEMDKIELSDFIYVPNNEYTKIAAQKLEAWANVYHAINKEELDWFIQLTNGQIQKIAGAYTDCYIFDLPAKAVHAKRHPHFSLYEFFVALFFCGNKNNENIVAYVLLSYS